MFTIHRKMATIYEINCNQFTRDIGLSAAEFSAEQERPGDTEENERIWTRSRLGVQMHLERVSAPSLAGADTTSEGSRPGKNRENCERSIKGRKCRDEAGNRWGPENGGTIENALMARCEISN